jgi:hypothetical protein
MNFLLTSCLGTGRKDPAKAGKKGPYMDMQSSTASEKSDENKSILSCSIFSNSNI